MGASSKMFTSVNNLEVEKTKFNEKKEDTQLMSSSNDKSKVLNQINDKNTTNIVMKPNRDAPKTVYSKRMYQKLKYYDTSSAKSKKSNCIKNSNSNTTKITQDKNKSLVNNENVIKDIASPIHYNYKSSPDCTLIICEPDITPTRSISIEDIHTKDNFEKLPTSDIIHNQNSPISENKNKISSLNSEVEQHPTIKKRVVAKKDKNVTTKVPLKRKKVVVEKDKNPTKITTAKKSCVTCLSPSLNNDFISSTNNLKTISTKNKITENSKSVTSKVPHNKNKSFVSIENVQKKIASTILDSNSKKNPDTTLVICEPDIIPTKSSFSQEHCVKNDSETNNEPSEIVYNQKSSTSRFENTNQIPSINIEVEQVPFKRKRVVAQTDKNADTNLTTVKKSSRATCLSSSVDNDPNMTTKMYQYKFINNEKESSSSYNQKENQPECELSSSSNIINKYSMPNVFKSSSDNMVETGLGKKTNIPSINIEVEQFPIRRKRVVIKRDDACAVTEVRKSSINSFNLSNEEKSNLSITNVQCLSISYENKSSNTPTQKNDQSKCYSSIINDVSDSKEYSLENDPNKSSSPAIETSLVNKECLPSISIEVEQGPVFRRSNVRKVTMCSNQEYNKPDMKKGRRVQLITIKDHYTRPLPSFNGAKKTEIDVSKNSVHIEKVVESSSLFYVPPVKRRRPMHFSSTD